MEACSCSAPQAVRRFWSSLWRRCITFSDYVPHRHPIVNHAQPHLLDVSRRLDRSSTARLRLSWLLAPRRSWVCSRRMRNRHYQYLVPSTTLLPTAPQGSPAAPRTHGQGLLISAFPPLTPSSPRTHRGSPTDHACVSDAHSTVDRHSPFPTHHRHTHLLPTYFPKQ
ncbi:hypothetical protein BKA81DRAFT_10297 [Phyllosticta paracitricarpa]|uniref:Uncharacterized protein n=2 Tax=Phyllosticta TaxID=121621 RepID=A0ABR1MJK7_9PEZI